MRNMISSTHVTGRNYGKPQVLIITAPAPIADAQGFIIDETFEVEFIDTVRGITGYVQLPSLEIGTFSTGPAVLREYDAGRYTESRRRPDPAAPVLPDPIVPDEIFKYWTPDEVAECMNVCRDTWGALWRIVGTQVRPLHVEHPEQLYPFALIHHWNDLTRDQQIECNKAAESES